MIVTCRSCGKKTPDGKLCQFCGGFLAPPIQCPGCRRTMAAGTTKCAFCGASTAPAKTADLVACPECGRKMASHLAACVMCGTPLRPKAGGGAGGGAFEDAMRQALQLARAGKFEEALPFVEQGLLVQPGNGEVWAIKGSCLHNLGRYEEALPCYREGVKLRPDDPAILFNMGNTLRLLRRLEDASSCYERAARLNPLNAEFQGNRALLLRELGRYGEAIPAAHAVLAAKPDAPPFLNCLGYCLLQTGKADQALAPLKKAAELDPRRAELWIDLGLCLEKMNRRDEADACFEKAAQADPIGPRANHHRARLLERRGQTAGAAEACYRAAIGFLIEQRSGPISQQSVDEQRACQDGLQRLRAHLARAADRDALFAAALQAEGEGRWNDALALYEEVSVLAPDNAFAAGGVVRMREARKGAVARHPALGRYAEALKDVESGDAGRGLRTLDELLPSFPLPGPLRVLKGRALVRLGKLDEALAAYDEAVAQAPDDVSAWLGTAEVLIARGDVEKALASAEAALGLDPRHPGAWTAKGDALRKMKRFSDARESYRKALEIDPHFAAAWAGRAEAEEALGRGADAKKSYEEVLALDARPGDRARAEARLAEMAAEGQARADRFQKAADQVLTGDAAQGLPVIEELLARPSTPKKETLWYLKGKGLLRLGRLEEALAAHEQAIALGAAIGWSGKAEVYEQMGDDALAFEAAQRAPASDHAALAIKGECFRKAGRLAEAMKCFGEALHHEEKDERALLGKARTEEALGQPSAALLSYLKCPPDAEVEERVKALLRDLPPSSNPLELAERGIALQDAKRFEDALACFLRLTELDPRAPGHWTGVANLYRELKRYDEALQAIDRALAPDPRDQQIVLLKSFILTCAGREAESKAVLAKLGAVDLVREAERLAREQKRDEALARLEKATGLDPDSDEAWCAKGQVLQMMGRRPESLAAFERAVKLNPEYRQALGGLGEALLQANRYAESETALVRCLEKKPDDPKPQMYLAYAREMQGKKEAALEGYARFLWTATDAMKEQIKFARQQHAALVQAMRPAGPKLPPSAAGPWLEKAGDHLRNGRLQEAVAAYDGAIKADPYGVIAFLNKGQILSQLGRGEEALRSLEQGVKLAPKLPGAWVMRGTVLAGLKRHEESLKSFEKALELDPFESASWGNKAACLNALGRREEALPCLERALVLDPFNVVAWYNRGCTERALGKTAEATVSLKRFLAIAPEGAEDQVEQARDILRELETGKGADEVEIAVPSKPIKAIGTRYEVYRELGRGGFGVVYLAVEKQQQQICALKTFLDERAADPESIRMFKAEAKTWIDLDAHPHLVRAYLVEEIEGRLYLSMELVAPGPDGLNTLEAYLRTRPPGLAQTLRWAIQFCHGMEYARSKGIRCHRDIKPANLMIDGRKRLKISDFGLAAAISTKSASSLQMKDGNVGLSMQGEGGGAGTPTHMPPEQWRSAAACDERSDLYAFGVTLYQMASKGRLPFLPELPRNPSPQEQQRFMAELFAMHLTATPAPLPSPLWPLIERCLRKNPAERYRSFQELRADLEPLLRGEAQGETVPAPEVGRLGADDFVNKAHSLDALGRTEEALKTFDEALRQEPGNALALEGKGFVLARAGRLAEALAALDAAGALGPKANSLFQAGRIREALPAYEQALAREPRNALLLRNKARCLHALGRVDEAMKTFDEALSIEPESASGWCDKGDALRGAGRHAEAVDALRKGLALDASRGRSWNLLGESLVALQRFDEALAAFDRAVAIDPSNSDSWTNRGGCLVVAGRLDDAMACYDRAIALSPAAAMAWNNKGDLYVRMKQPERAMECFDRALAAEPDMILAVQNKSLRLRDLGRLDEAIALLARGSRAHPGSSALWYFQGEFRKMKKEFEPAIAAYRKVLETERQNVRALAMALCHMGQCLEPLDRIPEAADAYRKALELMPGYPEAQQGLDRCRR